MQIKNEMKYFALNHTFVYFYLVSVITLFIMSNELYLDEVWGEPSGC